MWKKISYGENTPQWVQVSFPHLPEDCTDLDNEFNQQEGGHLYCPHAGHSYSGWKTHIFSTTPDEVSSGLEIAHPIIAAHGLGCKFANDAMLDAIHGTIQHGKGITIYHPDIRSGKHLDEMNELTDALKAGNHPAMGKIAGDTMVSPHAGVRYELTRNFYDDQTGKLRNVSADEYQRHYSPNQEEEEAPEIREALFHARRRQNQ
jgi:hypothetical protein